MGENYKFMLAKIMITVNGYTVPTYFVLRGEAVDMKEAEAKLMVCEAFFDGRIELTEKNDYIGNSYIFKSGPNNEKTTYMKVDYIRELTNPEWGFLSEILELIDLDGKQTEENKNVK
jgi:hypothetical protein